MAASSRELAVRLLYVRRPGAGVRRLFTPRGQVGGLVEKAHGDVRIGGGHCKLQKGCRLFTEIFFSRHNLVPRTLPVAAPGATTRCGGIRSGKESTKVNLIRGRVPGSPGAARQSSPKSLPVSLWMKCRRVQARQGTET